MDWYQDDLFKLGCILRDRNWLNVAQSSETNEKTIFPSLAFEIWSILCSKNLEFSKYFYQNNWPNMAIFFVPNDTQYYETYEKTTFKFLRFLVFEIWSILYSKLFEN